MSELTEEQKRQNLLKVFAKADQYAEQMYDRRECVRVQERIEEYRQRFTDPEGPIVMLPGQTVWRRQ